MEKAEFLYKDDIDARFSVQALPTLGESCQNVHIEILDFEEEEVLGRIHLKMPAKVKSADFFYQICDSQDGQMAMLGGALTKREQFMCDARTEILEKLNVRGSKESNIFYKSQVFYLDSISLLAPLHYTSVVAALIKGFEAMAPFGIHNALLFTNSKDVISCNSRILSKKNLNNLNKNLNHCLQDAGFITYVKYTDDDNLILVNRVGNMLEIEPLLVDEDHLVFSKMDQKYSILEEKNLLNQNVNAQNKSLKANNKI